MLLGSPLGEASPKTLQSMVEQFLWTYIVYGVGWHRVVCYGAPEWFRLSLLNGVVTYKLPPPPVQLGAPQLYRGSGDCGRNMLCEEDLHLANYILRDSTAISVKFMTNMIAIPISD
jgi:hypothetical protein